MEITSKHCNFINNDKFEKIVLGIRLVKFIGFVKTVFSERLGSKRKLCSKFHCTPCSGF